MSQSFALVTESDPVVVVVPRRESRQVHKDNVDSSLATNATDTTKIQVFTLELNGVIVELCSLGASITKWLVPAAAAALPDPDGDKDMESSSNSQKYDDIVLGYRSITDMYESGNTPYFGVIVGRVANRIANGQLWLTMASSHDNANDSSSNGNETATTTTATPSAQGPNKATMAANNKKVLYPLEINNPPNHLHGGFDGFSSRIWKAEIIELQLPSDDDDDGDANHPDGTAAATDNITCRPQQQQSRRAVQFTLVSSHMDQGYPGTVLVTATYSLMEPRVSATTTATTTGARLCLTMKASLVLDDATSTGNNNDCQAMTTPINLAQHSYFNLSRHDDPMGILSHQLQLPLCQAYTPLNEYSIPTRQVQYFDRDDDYDDDDDDQDTAAAARLMDFRQPKLLQDFMVQYGISKAGLGQAQAQEAVNSNSSIITRIHPRVASSSDTCRPPNAPYGLDHNYCVVGQDGDNKPDDDTTTTNSTTIARCANNNQKHDDNLHHVAHLQHEATRRQLDVWSNVPGVQVYTANYLDGTAPGPTICKNAATYRQWQGVCLETQHFPDSIMDNGVNDDDDSKNNNHADFVKGKCVILRPNEPHYEHCVEYQVVYPACDYSTIYKSSTDAADASCSTTCTTTRASFRGSDTNGNTYESPHHMWMHEQVLTPSGKREWYERAAEYYAENCPETIDGVLGGFAAVTQLDLKGSLAFVQELRQLRAGSSSSLLPNWSESTACEMGAGLGRVSKGLLLPLGFRCCDLVESSSRLLSAAPDYIGSDNASRCRFYCTSLQDWIAPAPKTYALIWIQWVFCYLVDDDAISFLRHCKEALVDGGLICLKENSCCTNSISSSTGSNQDTDDFVLDVEDASVTRSVPYLTHLAEQAGLRVVLMRLQDNFPDQLFAVPMLALEPVS